MNCYEVGKMTPSELDAWVKENDRSFSEKLREISEDLAQKDDLHFLGLTGPTCSGKTTAANQLIFCMEEHEKRLQVISVDDFFYDREHLEKIASEEGNEKPDYDSEKTIDLPLLKECITSLRNGEKTRLPRFSFRKGMREAGGVITPRKGDIFLFEGIQILYPAVREILSDEGYRSLYIAPLSSIRTGGEEFSPNEIRLFRRIVRDHRHRGAPPEFTFSMWDGVRENEEKNIFPFIDRCDVQIDSTMAYEVGLIKPFLQEEFTILPSEPAYREKAERILSKLKNVQSVPKNTIDQNSLYKEFI